MTRHLRPEEHRGHRVVLPALWRTDPLSRTRHRDRDHVPRVWREDLPAERRRAGPRAGPRPIRGFERLRRRRESLPDTADAPGWPANVLRAFAVVEFVLLFAGLLIFFALVSQALAKNGWKVRPEGRKVLIVAAVGSAAIVTKNVIVLRGVREMRLRQSYGMALAGAVAVLIPVELIIGVGWDAIDSADFTRTTILCGGCWAAGGFGVAIWALVVLLQGDVAARFVSNSRWPLEEDRPCGPAPQTDTRPARTGPECPGRARLAGRRAARFETGARESTRHEPAGAEAGPT